MIVLPGTKWLDMGDIITEEIPGAATPARLQPKDTDFSLRLALQGPTGP